MLRSLLVLLTLLAAAYVVVLVVLYLVQDRLLYLPTASLPATPADYDLAYEDVTIPTVDGEQLHAWWIPANGACATVLFLHGNAGNISGRIALAEALHDLPANVLLLDYRGYGRSTGRPSEEGLYRDAEAAWTYLTRTPGVDPRCIIPFGRSLGGGPAVWLATQHRVAALILAAPFTSLPDVAAIHYPVFPTRALVRSRFDNTSRIRDVGVPLLVIHSPDDDIIPYEQGRQLFEAAAEPKAFLTTRGGHNAGAFFTDRRYLDSLRAFVARHVESDRYPSTNTDAR